MTSETAYKQLVEAVRREVYAEVAAKFKAVEPGTRGPLRGAKYGASPCPVPGCGMMNHRRAVSNLCVLHTTDANRAKYRGKR